MSTELQTQASKRLKAIMEKPVTRRQFLGHIGLLLVSIFGFSSVLSLLLDNQKHLEPAKKATHGFGAGKFGS